MSRRVEPPDTPPADGYMPLVQYAARHGMPYQRVYDRVRWGYVASVRHAGRWWVRADAPPPILRRGGWNQAKRLQVIRAQRSAVRRAPERSPVVSTPMHLRH
jgi:hypothetical protein